MNTKDSLTDIWEGCLRQEPKYQDMLYKKLTPKMLPVCMRYAKDKDEAQDIMQEGFIKVFKNLSAYRNEGSLEGWIYHIMVNTAINRFNKRRQIVLVDDFADDVHLSGSTFNNNNLETQDLMRLIGQLPDNYRSVFNLYAIEGYSHHEISNRLGVSEILSRANLNRARGILKNKLNKLREEEMHYMVG